MVKLWHRSHKCHIGAPGIRAWPCSLFLFPLLPWEAAVMAQVLGSLPPRWMMPAEAWLLATAWLLWALGE